MRLRFQADADLKYAIVKGVRQREPSIDFASAAESGLASGVRIALLINFQHPNVEWKRIIHGFGFVSIRGSGFEKFRVERELLSWPRMHTNEHELEQRFLREAYERALVEEADNPRD